MEIKSFFLLVLYAFVELFLGSGGAVSLIPGLERDEEKAISIDLTQALTSARKLGQNLAQVEMPKISFRATGLTPAPAKKIGPTKVIRAKKGIAPQMKKVAIQPSPKEVRSSDTSLLLGNEEIAVAKKIQNSDVLEAIDDRQMIQHYGFTADVPQIVAWNDYFKTLDLDGRLARLKKEEASRQLLARQKEEATGQLLAEQKDVPLSVPSAETLSTATASHANNDDTPVFYEYAQKEGQKDIQGAAVEVEDRVTETRSGLVAGSEPLASPASLAIGQAAPETPTSRKVAPPVHNSIDRLGQAPLSSVVNRAIHREIKNLANPKRRVASQTPSLTPLDTHQVVMANQAMSIQMAAQRESSVILHASQAEINGNSGRTISSFQFIPDYDKNQTFNADEAGNISFSELLNDSHSLLRGTLIRYGMMRTKVEIPLAQGTYDLTVPMLTQETIGRFVGENGIGQYGGFILVDLDEGLEDVDIDRQYQGRVFLDRNFKVVESPKDCRYIFYAGVDAGNVLMRFLLPDGRSTYKISHVVSDEVLFEQGRLSPAELKAISLFERHSLGLKASELEVAQESLGVFNADVAFTKEGLNRFEAEFPVRPLGARHFVDLARPDGRLFVGLNSQDELEIPSEDFIENILSVHQLDNLEGPCIVQINLAKTLQTFSVDGDDRHGAMSFRKTFLDKNGIFSEEVTGVSQKAFLIGETPGVFNIRAEYQDGTADYLQSFCSESAYLVEVL